QAGDGLTRAHGPVSRSHAPRDRAICPRRPLGWTGRPVPRVVRRRRRCRRDARGVCGTSNGAGAWPAKHLVRRPHLCGCGLHAVAHRDLVHAGLKENTMSHVVVLGAGLGGTTMAYELRDLLGTAHKISVVNKGTKYSFVPSNPWVAVGWREREQVEIDLEEVFRRRDIGLYPQGAKRLNPATKSIELLDGSMVAYDYLVIATGPDLAFDEIPGFGPAAETQSVCFIDHALEAKLAFDTLVANPGPVVIGAVQGASCFGPAYEFAFILEKALRDAKVRDRVPMTFVTSEPYIGHLGLDGVGDTRGLLESEMREHHIKWITNARVDKFEAGKVFVSEMAEDGAVKQSHEVPFVYSMMLPAFRGVEAVRGIEGLTNPRGFILADKYQRNPAFP